MRYARWVVSCLLWADSYRAGRDSYDIMGIDVTQFIGAWNIDSVRKLPSGDYALRCIFLHMSRANIDCVQCRFRGAAKWRPNRHVARYRDVSSIPTIAYSHCAAFIPFVNIGPSARCITNGARISISFRIYNFGASDKQLTHNIAHRRKLRS